MGRFDWFWKAMGSTTERNNKKSKAVVVNAHGLIDELSLPVSYTHLTLPTKRIV